MMLDLFNVLMLGGVAVIYAAINAIDELQHPKTFNSTTDYHKFIDTKTNKVVYIHDALLDDSYFQ